MDIFLYNSLTRQKTLFQPIRAAQVGLYVCGNTVYDDCHIGHARVFVSFDVLVRFLKALGYQVHYVRNLTDIDDKIIARAAQTQESIQALTERYTQRLQEDTRALGVLDPDQEPKATAAIAQMITLIEQLLKKGRAYVAGDVYYRVSAFKSYGTLAHRVLADLKEGARVEIDPHKEDPLDFVLWKQAKAGEPAWDSPWGPGRPGWHIECSAMSMECLGPHFDIHGGGADLLFPHHENERAQSEGVTDHPFVNTWMHVGFLKIDGEKMSKSLGNFLTLRSVLEHYEAEVIRYFLLSGHYRSQMNYSPEVLQQAKQSLTRLYTALKACPGYEGAPVLLEQKERFLRALADDLNTPEALALLFDWAHALFKGEAGSAQDSLGATLYQCGQILGLFTREPGDFLQGGSAIEHQSIEALIQARQEARLAKNWAEADRLRAALGAQGIVLEDNQGQTTWRRA